jgi:hypothetical protein
MAQVETEKLTQILWGAALSRAVCTIAELGHCRSDRGRLAAICGIARRSDGNP